jgi:hypothetical protein
LHDAALGNESTRTSRKRIAKFAAQPFQRRNLSFNHGQVTRSDLINS